tara:strand:- start:1238 stop:3589 length:2352 start_codon:yes stop_codon:yes gene_type:complete
MSCEEKPNFVIVKQTGLGFSFDNNVTYNSPLANHTLSQAQGVSHPSLIVKSEWGITSKNTITQLLTGQAAIKLVKTGRGHLGTKDLLIKKKVNKRTGKESIISKFGLIAPSNNNKGYTLTRIGNRNEGLSVAELAILLRDISNKPTNIKVRGSPLEYKRLLDYIQFLMVEKVTNDSTLFLARPNDYRVMDAVHTDGISLENAYNGIDENNSTMYGKAYFVTMDRVAALASVVRKIPTLYQTGSQYYYNVPTTNSIPKIQEILAKMLKDKNYTMPKTTANGYTNRTQELTTPSGRPIITSGPLFAWFLDTRNIGEKMNADGKTRTIGSDFHGLTDEDKASILFYWAFNYPGSTDENIKVIKYFLAILDTFHDFTDTKRIKNFKKMWPESNNTAPHTNAKTKTRNGLSNKNIPPTTEQHKFLVKLLGIDIYRKVGKYNKTITNTLSKTNKRGAIPIQLRVAHFLYFITNILGSKPSRGIITACEELSRNIMIKLSNDTHINKPLNFGENICKLLDKEKSCLVIDAINGSVPTCMKKYSVFHNVGIIDPADKGILSWGEILGIDGCIESAKVIAAKKKEKKRREAAKRASVDAAARREKAKKTRAQRIKNEAAAKAKANIDADLKAKQARARRNALSIRRGIKSNTKQVNNKKPVNNKKLNEKFRKLGNMKMNISKPPKKTISTPKPQTDSGARMTVPKNQVFNFKINNNKNNKLTPKKPNNGVINNARLELNKLTSLRQNQKSNYLEKIKQTPTNIPSILNNAKQVASRQRATRSRTPARTQTPK